MNLIQKKRLGYLFLFLMGLASGAGLIFYALKQNLNVFLTPSQILTAQLTSNDVIRLGGLVKKQSLLHEAKSLSVQFVVTDNKNDIPVHYVGVLPDLFREGKGVIVEGKMENGILNASQVLAKHDENYMPRSVYEAMRKNNV